ncbi:GNAT family N-acetyltransferase [Metabacillus sp. B2-18]|uniref:GNAT family N-acetyltransferase n=1 Tax=Metabacillus sp. B2-18 TaxID=2897333 RepID=UPI001E3ED7A6|nr:GNAT family N-acetyltransferase [Metabacillus sp. B2-18]UGB32008.1 GNAT family N-acetyltransferase [Metabacillus sp. B2-18]
MHNHFPYTIHRLQQGEYSHIIEFVMKMRQELFPMLKGEELPQDLLNFEKSYIQTKNAAFFYVVSEDGEIIGSVGVTPYDGRFQQLKDVYHLSNSAEIVKCYIDSNYRRLGIGTALSKMATSYSKKSGYRSLYLHTHPFLPGAIPFWKSQGYKEILAEDDPVWQTLHMVKTV